MPIDYEEVRAHAGDEMVSLTKRAGVVLAKKNIRPGLDKAAVIATFDRSGSTERDYELYSSGRMQRVADLAFAAGLQFDDDGEVPVTFFDNSVHKLGNVTVRNCRGFLADADRRYSYGGTEYLSALRWIVQEAGYGHVNLGSLPQETPQRPKHHLFGGRHSDQPVTKSGLRIRATAPYPTFAIFVTDGEPQDSHAAIREYLTLMSQLPIFVQFIGLGARRFEFLEDLDTMDGRLVDNANFFNGETTRSEDAMLENLLGEFPDYYRKGREIGLITG